MTILTRPRPRHWSLPAVAVTGLFALAGCTGGDEEPDAAPSPVVVGEEELTPIVETTVEVPHSDDDEVTLGLVSLVAKGETTEMRLLMTPHYTFEEDALSEQVSIFDMFGDDVFPQLVDIDRVTTYDVVGGMSSELETDVVRAQTTNDEPILYQAWFPRPKGDPETLDVWLHGEWPTIEDVPVTYED